MVDLVDSTKAAIVTTPTLWSRSAPKLNETIVYAVLLSILACVGIVGNGFVILAFKVNNKLRSVTNACFVSLALCDFLVSFISIPLWIFVLFNPQRENSWQRHLYVVYIFLEIFNSTASIFQLTAMSLERCFSIVAPVRHRAVSTRFYYIMLLTVWILAAFSCSFLFIFQNTVMNHIYTVVVCFSLPILIMVTSYTLLFRTAMKRSRVNVSSNENHQAIWSGRLKIVVTLLIITGLFFITWSPFFTYNFLIYCCPSALPNSIETQIRILRFAKWMHYCNSSLNPFVYAYRHNEFNHSFKAIFHACMKCKRYNEVSRELRRQNNHLQLELGYNQNVPSEGEVARQETPGQEENV